MISEPTLLRKISLRHGGMYNRDMFRLLGFIAFATLLILIICGAGTPEAHSQTAHHDQLEPPPAVSTTTALESAPNLTATITPMVPVKRGNPGERFPVAGSVSLSFRDPLTASSVLRV